MSSATYSFGEREFYLAEFRRRSIGFVWPAAEAPEPAVLRPLIDELVANQTRVILLSAREDVLEHAGITAPFDCDVEDLASKLWRALEATGRAGIRIPEAGFEDECRRAALFLRPAKIVWIQSVPPIMRNQGDGRVSVVDLAHLRGLLGDAEKLDSSDYVSQPEHRVLIEVVRDLIESGVPAVNVCAPGDITNELLTYAGAGTFFTRDRYAEVRTLGLDDFDPASDLIARGESDGYLVARDAASRDHVLAHAVGLFIEGRYLAGIGAILPYPEDRAAEVASLYALTRYVGEGVGGQIVQYAIDRAAREGLEYLFSCTTSDRVETFFVRHGFRVVDPDVLPKRKWEDYAEERRARVRCLRFDF